ncbi:MAG: glutaredoxin family protein [Proteobacteria bacterium]|nr:glutaredoxin family protein [Pseudomonadota bacterium]
MAVGGRLTLLTREGCGLCEEMAEELAVLGTRLEMPPIECLDVDSDPELLRRHGHRIPVLLWDGVAVAATRLDPAEIEGLFRSR